MDHVAILKKSLVSKNDSLLTQIIVGNKTIESRWYKKRIAPWNMLSINDNIYFKESGCPVTVTGVVDRFLQFESLTTNKITEILTKYGSKIAPGISPSDLAHWQNSLGTKKYCLLIFLSNVKKITPFSIDKKGFGISSAWISVPDIKQIII